MSSQQAASDYLETLYKAADAAPVFVGFRLFSMPLSEVSAVGNGAVYYAPTAGGPLLNLTTENGDFLASGGSDSASDHASKNSIARRSAERAPAPVPQPRVEL